ncbi:carbohydrate-binding protein [Tamlana sp. 2_MG-2023]|uniref:carbohydrate-binding protein n=1 Tax=unclassified Tamlana TaxID=2614803 RepID=UPI0026E1DEB1|nr:MULTISPECIES: carbohydrate-binding protein [unclassified Tamlana]MDO6761413.1 carbohydrate-binding protein [Tamlana sp. 2_MG-2023]MDO6792143.1 carbohydrate-binding protein [Tamlana sp. 1_MG-2023]
MKNRFSKVSKATFFSLATSALIFTIFACSSEEVLETETASEAEKTAASAYSKSTLSSKSAVTIQAEAYDSQSGIKTENTADSGGGLNVGWIDTGDYLEYDIDVPASGSYKFEFRVASKTNTSKFDFYQDGTKLSNVNKASTGSYQSWVTTSKTVDLSAGSSTLKLLATGGGWNINWIRITPVDVDESTSENLALGKTAEQSSVSHGGNPSRAVDGNTNGAWSNGSVTHTSSEAQPWWQVRLGQDYTIGSIKIFNRTDSCCKARLNNFDVFVYKDNGDLAYKTTITDSPNPSVTINTGGVTGARVRIKLKDTNALSLAEVQVFSTGGDDSGSGGGDSGSGEVEPGNASIPSDLMSNCNQWKITYPDGVEDKTLCGEANNEYFYVNSDKNGMVFRVPIRSNNGSTPNSDYIRSELREREADGGSDIYWTTSGTHVVYVQQAITHLPIVKDHLVATQIHGNKSDGIDDAMVLRLEGSHLFLSFNGGVLRDEVTIKTNYSLGTTHEVIFEVKDGKHYCYYSEDGNLKNAYANGNASSYLVKDGSNSVLMDRDYGEAYFKIGNYTQSNAEKEGSETGKSNNYGEVVVYDYYVEH